MRQQGFSLRRFRRWPFAFPNPRSTPLTVDQTYPEFSGSQRRLPRAGRIGLSHHLHSCGSQLPCCLHSRCARMHRSMAHMTVQSPLRTSCVCRGSLRRPRAGWAPESGRRCSWYGDKDCGKHAAPSGLGAAARLQPQDALRRRQQQLNSGHHSTITTRMPPVRATGERPMAEAPRALLCIAGWSTPCWLD